MAPRLWLGLSRLALGARALSPQRGNDGSGRRGSVACEPLVHQRRAQTVTVALLNSDVNMASLAQLAEHALRKRMVMGSIPIGGFMALRQCRRRGGIEPLCVSTPHELKSCPSTSPTHPGSGNPILPGMPPLLRREGRLPGPV